MKRKVLWMEIQIIDLTTSVALLERAQALFCASSSSLPTTFGKNLPETVVNGSLDIQVIALDSTDTGSGDREDP